MEYQYTCSDDMDVLSVQAGNDVEGLDKLSGEVKRHILAKHPDMSVPSDDKLKIHVQSKMKKEKPVHA